MRIAIFGVQTALLEQLVTQLQSEHGAVNLEFFSHFAQADGLSINGDAYLLLPDAEFDAERFALVVALEPLQAAIAAKIEQAQLPCLQSGAREGAKPLVHGLNADGLAKADLAKQLQAYYLPNGVDVTTAKLLHLLAQAYGLSCVNVCVLQAQASIGEASVQALAGQTARLLNGLALEENPFAQQLAFNALPGAVPAGATLPIEQASDGEAALEQTIAGLIEDDCLVTTSIVGVPVFYGDTVELALELAKEVELDDLREQLSASDYFVASNEQELITPVSHAQEREQVYIARLRQSINAKDVINMTVVADNVRNGAAFNTFGLVNFLIKHVL